MSLNLETSRAAGRNDDMGRECPTGPQRLTACLMQAITVPLRSSEGAVKATFTDSVLQTVAPSIIPCLVQQHTCMHVYRNVQKCE